MSESDSTVPLPSIDPSHAEETIKTSPASTAIDQDDAVQSNSSSFEPTRVLPPGFAESTSTSFPTASASAHAHLRSVGNTNATSSSTTTTTTTNTSTGGSFTSRRTFLQTHESIQDIRLFDGKNSPQNIAVYGFGLGALFGAGLILATIVQTPIPQFWFFLAALGVFHSLEYIAIALFNPNKLTLDSFLLNHSPEYTMATASGVTEFLIEYYFFPGIKTWGLFNKLGLVMLIIGQIARTWAMFSAKSNFSHHVEYYKEDHHILVTHGIYSILRHPSYFGFYYWALGSQLMLMNPICFIGFALALHHFFSERIKYEEQLLVRFFGDDYRKYQTGTRTGLPMIP
ncbi:hypothetical protein BGW38_001301 [Lunasporangiospora selenospora]|uniref:Protein-S-isoprenylcysteine O-methyltransferase n=1 Tax=Lunasporangiospora selenospora TaxID=979761 RepID=A0A9P6FU47_9FUNG|nr:hypothetical protein BGW38_001301 [Lunasporangiospora selenospora]